MRSDLVTRTECLAPQLSCKPTVARFCFAKYSAWYSGRDRLCQAVCCTSTTFWPHVGQFSLRIRLTSGAIASTLKGGCPASGGSHDPCAYQFSCSGAPFNLGETCNEKDLIALAALAAAAPLSPSPPSSPPVMAWPTWPSAKTNKAGLSASTTVPGHRLERSGTTAFPLRPQGRGRPRCAQGGFNFEGGSSLATGAGNTSGVSCSPALPTCPLMGGFGEIRGGRTLTTSYYSIASWELTGTANYPWWPNRLVSLAPVPDSGVVMYNSPNFSRASSFSAPS